MRGTFRGSVDRSVPILSQESHDRNLRAHSTEATPLVAPSGTPTCRP